MSNFADHLFLGTRKGLFVLRDSGSGWHIVTVAFPGLHVPMLLPDARDQSLYAAIGHGHFGTKLHRSTDLGVTWSEITAPAYPPKPADIPDLLCPMRQTPIPWNLELIWSLEAGGGDRPGRLWCGTIPGGLFRSDDHGATWSLNRPLWDHPDRAKWFGGGYDYPGIHSICVDPRNSDHLTLGISCAGVWGTTDAGVTWRQQAHGMIARYLPPDVAQEPDSQDPHRLVQCRDNPDTFWVQHHNGIFRSTNGGTAWEEVTGVEPSAFGFAVAVHPADGRRAWFVPATGDEVRIPVDGRVVVTRTSDNGKSFAILGKGLPDTHAYDLVYRHGLAVDRTGNHLAFGSTTGGLWTSRDQGDSWDQLGNRLPPVYCVRFGHGG